LNFIQKEKHWSNHEEKRVLKIKILFNPNRKIINV